MRKLLLTFLMLGFAALGVAQQPYTNGPHAAPVFATNSKWVQGVGPGYWPYSHSGLTLNLSPGSIVCGGTTPVTYAGGTLTFAINTTNYVQLDVTSSCVPISNTSGFLAGNSPIAVVITNGTVITSVADWRPFGVNGGGGGSGVPAGPLNAVQTNAPLGDFYGSSDFTYDDVNNILLVGDNPFSIPSGLLDSLSIGDTNVFGTNAPYQYLFGQNITTTSSSFSGNCLVIGFNIGSSGAPACEQFAATTSGVFVGYNGAQLQVVPSANGAPYANLTLAQDINPSGSSAPVGGHLACPSSTPDNTVQLCGTSATNWIGITEDTGGTTATSGMALMALDNTATLGDSVCVSITTAGEGHDSGSNTPCTGGLQVGWVMSLIDGGASSGNPLVFIDGAKVAGGGGGSPNADTPACYVSYYGNDTNSGLSIVLPKQSIMGCYDALPLGGGTIFIYGEGGGGGNYNQTCLSTDPAGCGIWILGSTDPNYSSPPAGWRKYKGPVNFIGVASQLTTQFANAPQVSFNAGGQGDLNHPAIWLTGHTPNITFKNLETGGFPWTGMKLGIDSNGLRTDGATVTGVLFDNVGIQLNQAVGAGPAVDIGTGVFNVWFINCGLFANGTEAQAITSLSRASNVVTVTTTTATSVQTGDNVAIVGASDPTFNGYYSATNTGTHTFTYTQSGLNGGPNASATGGYASTDRAAAMYVWDGNNANTSGNIYVTGGIATGGSFRLVAGANGLSWYGSKILQEGGYGPLVYVPVCTGYTDIGLYDSNVSDAYVNAPILQADCQPSPLTQIVASNNTGGAVGPMAAMGQVPGSTIQSYQNPGPTPISVGLTGVFAGHLVGQTDTSRRAFGPVASRFVNLAKQSIGSWTDCVEGITSVSAVAAPDGTTNAGELVGASPTAYNCAYNSTFTTTAGDWIIAGVWIRGVTGGYLPGLPGEVKLGSTTFVNNWTPGQASQINLVPPWNGSGEWKWAWGAKKVAVGHTSDTVQLIFQAGLDNLGNPQTTDFFAPVLIHIAAGTVSDNEAMEIAYQLSPYRDDAVAGQVSLMRGEQFFADSITTGTGGTVKSDNFCIGSSCITSWPSGGGGGLSSFAAPSGSWPAWLVPTVTNPTSTPSLAVAVGNVAAHTVFGNFTGSGAAPGFTAAPTFSAANLTNFPTLNQPTTSTAANLSGTPALPDGTTATTQSPGDTTSKLATDTFVATIFADPPVYGSVTPADVHAAALTSSGTTTLNGTTIPASATLTQTIFSGSLALHTNPIALAGCDTNTITATGVVSTDIVKTSPNATITTVTGYVPTGPVLTIYPPFASANLITVKVCNNAQNPSSITPGAVTLNLQVVR